MSFVEPIMDFRQDDGGVIAKIVVIGVGGAGGNAVERMIEAQMSGVQFVAINTDAQAIHKSSSPKKFTIGPKATCGLGAGGNPDKGKSAAEEDRDKISEIVSDADMVFITAGMGGGTGTGAAPVVAEIAKKSDALTVAVVTKPFDFEGKRRLQNATKGIEELQDIVDTLIVIPNQRLLSIVERQTSLKESFAIADEILHQAVRNISDLITKPWEINLDFADVRAILSGVGGDALIGIGEAEGENAAIEAARAAITNPMLEDVSIEGAKGVLLSITGGPNLTMYDVHEASSLISKAAGEDANFIFGTAIDESMGNSIRIGVIAAGFKRNQQKKILTQPFVQKKKKPNVPDIFNIFEEGEISIPTPEPIVPKQQKAVDYIPEDSSEEFLLEPLPKKEMFIEPPTNNRVKEEKNNKFDPNMYDLPDFYETPTFMRNKKKEVSF